MGENNNINIHHTSSPTSSKEQERTQDGRLIGLDILRAIAILLVLVGHGHEVPLFLKPINNFGWAGVDFFFVLSGFLIGGLLLNDIKKTGSIRIYRFYIRRGFKIWPSYYIFILTWGLLYQRNNFNLLIPGIFHTQNYFINPIPHTWSLAVEEHFYFLLPSIMILLLRISKEKLLKSTFSLWILLIVGCFFMRFYSAYVSWNAGRFDVMIIQTQTQFRIDSLMGGVLLAVIKNQMKTEYFSIKLKKIISLILITSTMFSSVLFFVPRDTKWYIIVVWPLILQITAMSYLWILKDFKISIKNKASILMANFCIFIAKISYNTYLWHWLINALLNNPKLAKYFIFGNFYVYFFVSIFTGWAMTTLIEKPFLKLRDRVIP